MFCKADTDRGREGVVQTHCVLELGGLGAAPQWQTQMLLSRMHRQGYEVCCGGGELSSRLGAGTTAQQGQSSASSCPGGSSSTISPTGRSTLQQDKRALSPGNSWLSYFSFRPHLLVGAVVMRQAGRDIQDAFFRSPRSKPNLPLQLCREKCTGKLEKPSS